MNMREVTTTDLSDFGYREWQLLKELVVAKQEQGFPEDFDLDGVHVMMNKNSGNVFFTNGEYQTCMMDGDKLETWYYCFNCGHEGFKDDCLLNEDGCNECNEQEGV